MEVDALSNAMAAMVLEEVARPLARRILKVPEAGPGQVLVRVKACGVCRTDLHVADGELPNPKLPLILGHEIVGEIVHLGSGVTDCAIGTRVGIPWLAWTCGICAYCSSGRENLCPQARFTGYQVDGGYAQFALADARYVFPIPGNYDWVHAAPLLCAGLIGYRSWKMAQPAEHLGMYGFGAAAHLLVQLAAQRGQKVYAFTRPGDTEAQRLAIELGAFWSGDSTAPAPKPLDAAIIFAPVGGLVPAALQAVRPGGTVVCAGIHMSDIPTFPYRLLWMERVVRSVANLTRADGEEFFRAIAQTPIVTKVHTYPLDDANRALEELKTGKVHGAAVLVVDRDP